MINLAGHKDADRIILDELRRCRIEAVEHHAYFDTEVRTKYTGRLGPFSFRRACRYWVANGPVPIAVARELYADPVGVTDIRVDGHCGCPAPGEFGTRWVDLDGRKVLSMAEHASATRYAASDSDIIAKVGRDVLAEHRFDEDPTRFEGFIDTYHIDSEVGLRIFADMIRAKVLSAEVVP